MVRMELAMPVPGVTEATENEQIKVLGQPLTESMIGLLNDPDCVLAVILRVFDCPAGIVSDEGDALKDKVAGCTLGLQARVNFVAPEMWFAMPGLPTA
jgi:hypothetical protein